MGAPLGQARRAEGFPAHDGAVPLGERAGDRRLEGRERDPAAPMVQQPVLVDHGCRRLAVGPAGERGHAGLHVARVDGHSHPVLERVDGGGRVGGALHEQEAGRAGVAGSIQPVLFAGPADEHHVHVGDKVRTAYFTSVTPL